MSRYIASRIQKDDNEKRKLSTTIIPTAPLNGTDFYIQTTSVERLDKLAKIFYEDTSLWWIIAAANGLGKGTYIIPENTRLRIPDKTNMQQIINNTNSSR